MRARAQWLDHERGDVHPTHRASACRDRRRRRRRPRSRPGPARSGRHAGAASPSSRRKPCSRRERWTSHGPSPAARPSSSTSNASWPSTVGASAAPRCSASTPSGARCPAPPAPTSATTRWLSPLAHRPDRRSNTPSRSALTSWPATNCSPTSSTGSSERRIRRPPGLHVAVAALRAGPDDRRRDPGRAPTRSELHLVTPERRALDLFGARASAAVTELLEAARIALHCGIDADVRAAGTSVSGASGPWTSTASSRSPVSTARASPGLPADAHGFIPVDELRPRPRSRRRVRRRRRDRPPDQARRPCLPAGRRRRCPCRSRRGRTGRFRARTARCSAGGCSPGLSRDTPSALVAAGEGLRPLPRAVPRGARTRGPSAAPERR